MTDIAIQEPVTALSALSPAQIGTLLEVLGIPDVSALDLTAASPQDKVEIREAFRAQLRNADAIIAELKQPVTNLVAQCEADIMRAIPAGASQLPHPTYTVKRMIGTDRYRGVAGLRADLPNTELPDEEFRKIVFIKSVKTKNVDPAIVEKLQEFGGEVEWECDLTKADAAAKTYGGVIADIIQKHTAKFDKGSPFLVIEPKQSAIKRVGQ